MPLLSQLLEQHLLSLFNQPYGRKRKAAWKEFRLEEGPPPLRRQPQFIDHHSSPARLPASLDAVLQRRTEVCVSVPDQFHRGLLHAGVHLPVRRPATCLMNHRRAAQLLDRAGSRKVCRQASPITPTPDFTVRARPVPLSALPSASDTVHSSGKVRFPGCHFQGAETCRF